MRTLAGALVALGAILAGCQEDLNSIGDTAVSVNADGQPVIVVAVCESSINSVSIFEGRDGLSETEENPKVGEWRTTSGLDGVVELDVAEPGDSWEPHEPVRFEPHILYLVEADGDDGAAGGVNFHGRDLAKLTPDEVMVEGGDIQKRTAFERSCD